MKKKKKIIMLLSLIMVIILLSLSILPQSKNIVKYNLKNTIEGKETEQAKVDENIFKDKVYFEDIGKYSVANAAANNAFRGDSIEQANYELIKETPEDWDNIKNKIKEKYPNIGNIDQRVNNMNGSYLDIKGEAVKTLFTVMYYDYEKEVAGDNSIYYDRDILIILPDGTPKVFKANMTSVVELDWITQPGWYYVSILDSIKQHQLSWAMTTIYKNDNLTRRYMKIVGKIDEEDEEKRTPQIGHESFAKTDYEEVNINCDKYKLKNEFEIFGLILAGGRGAFTVPGDTEDTFEAILDDGSTKTLKEDIYNGKTIFKGREENDFANNTYDTQRKNTQPGGEIDIFDEVLTKDYFGGKAVVGFKATKIGKNTYWPMYFGLAQELKIGVVTARYVDENGKELANSVSTKYNIDDHYTTEQKQINGYVIKTVPENKEGTVNKEDITVTYVYKSLESNVVVHHYIEGTTKKVPLKGDGSVAEDEEKKGELGQKYTTSPKGENELDSKYELVKIPSNANGTYGENTIQVIYYYKLKDFPYTVHYFYDGVEDVTKVENGKAPYNSQVNNYTDKNIAGYSLDRAENIPLNITGNADKNVINVYYKKDASKIGYTVEYYKDNVKQENDTQIVTDISTQNMLNVDKSKINTKDKYAGYVFSKTNPETILDSVENGTVIKVYYVSVKGGLVIKYLDKNSGKEISKTINTSGKVGTEFDITDSKKEIDGYTLIEEPKDKKGTYTEQTQEKIYYYAKNTKATVQYIDQTTGAILEQKTENGYVGKDFETIAKDFTGYILIKKPEQTSVKMTEDEVILKYYYVKASSGVIEKHVDSKTGEVLYTKTYEGNVGDDYNTESKEFSGYVLVKNKYPENAKGKMEVEAITVTYYYAKQGKVTIQYIDTDINQPIIDSTILNGLEGDPYTSDKKVFNGYEFVKVEGEENGTMSSDTVVKYYYKRTKDTITTNTSLPKTGITKTLLVAIVIIALIGTITFTKYKNMD